MATKYTLTTAFTAITETSGTIQNVGNELVELASSTNAVEGEGIVLNPSEKRSFKGALSARSIGDAGADVNVVDFTEAGEGGEEYILPVASDTTLGGVKISNSFTVASDGTLSIKKSGKTILGAVKSSDDEGKVTVNNDGTMTYNPLGYRQPSTAYAVGNIAYHNALPTDYYLECTTAGTTGSGDITPTSTIGSTVTDGTVVWTIVGKNFKHRGAETADFNNATDTGIYTYFETTANNPVAAGTDGNGHLLVFNNRISGANRTLQIAAALRGRIFTRTYFNNDWLDWQQQEAIVAKSLGANGYIKYASGLIIQWGTAVTNSSNPLTITLPIAFPSEKYRVALGNARPLGSNVEFYEAFFTTISSSQMQITTGKSPATLGSTQFDWLAIGY